jgi:uncharacterized protein involved in outer membrane biogenesis
MKNAGIYIVCFLVFVAISFVMLPDIILKKQIENYGERILGTEVDIDSIDLSLFSSKLTIKSLTVRNPKKYKRTNAIQIDEIVVDLRPLSLLGEVVEIQTLKVSGPIVTVEASMAGNNFNDMRKSFFKKESPADTSNLHALPKNSGKFVTIDTLIIDEAKIYVTAGFSKHNDQPASIIIPTITMENLGTENNHITFKQLLNKIIIEAAKDIDHVDQSMLNGVIEDLNKSIKDLSDQFKNLF